MTIHAIHDLNNFCSGHLIVNKDRKITFCNDFIAHLSDLSIDKLIETPLSACFTKASNIFIDSYIYPLLLNELVVQESQITWLGKNGIKIPVVVNIKLGQQGTSYWSLYVCTNRDKLQSELINAKQALEDQAKELFHLATTDPLTGLLNRRELYTQANKVIQQVARNPSSFALLSIDIDFFKRINDTYGHKSGDNVLKQLASLLTEERRANDIVARTGGEEFILLLPGIDENNAFLFAEKLRKKIQRQSIDNLNITVSIGLVISHKGAKVDFDTLLNLSDEALYESKNTGRNKTTTAHYS